MPLYRYYSTKNKESCHNWSGKSACDTSIRKCGPRVVSQVILKPEERN